VTGRAIERVPAGVTAFVGRTLKGPVAMPVRIQGFAGYQQIFGGLWQPSLLSYAVEQFFDNGGGQAVIVRAINGARPPTLDLPAGAGTLRLIAINPGSREYLRAAVDYDGIKEQDHFNLIVQRLAAAGSERVQEQEILRGLSIAPGSPRFVTRVLQASALARVHGAAPQSRPNPTGLGGGAAAGYAVSNADGDDGGPLSDYDVIGSQPRCTGIFALGPDVQFDLLYIPPLTRDVDLGLSTLLVAASFCRERRVLQIVDPPQAWTHPQTVLDGLASWPFRSDDAAMFYPRLLAFDRLRNRMATFAPGAAAAGMLARTDAAHDPWQRGQEPEPALRPMLRPVVSLTAHDSERLAQSGVNTLESLRPGPGRRARSCTLSAGVSASADGHYLAARRLALQLANSIERGTRWVLTAPAAPQTWERAGHQVEEFLEALRVAGAFAAGDFADCCLVVWDERVNRASTLATGAVNLLFGYAPQQAGVLQCWLVTHHPAGSRVRPVSINQQAAAPRRDNWAIETAVLNA
jgi:Bacteriophage tail sheath protein